MQLGRLTGLGEILQAVGQGCFADRGEAGPGKLLLAVGGGGGGGGGALGKVCSLYPSYHPFIWKMEECFGRQLCT